MEDNEMSNGINAENLTSNQKREIERKRIEEGAESKNLIASEGRILDVRELIYDSEKIAVRIKTLLENGITEEMLENKYMEISSGVSDKDIALGNLMSVCDMFIKYLSDIPNGIIIDPATGEIDKEKSIQSAVECGILSESDVIIIDPIDKIFEIKKEPTIMEFLDSTIFTKEEQEFIYWNYNRTLGELLSTRRGSIKNWDDLSKAYKEIAKAQGKTDEEIDRDLKDLRWLDKSNFSVKEIDFFMKVDFFANKDTHIAQEFLKKVLGKYEDVKFYKEIINENGDIDIESIKILKERFIKANNITTLFVDAEKYNKFRGDLSVESLDEVNKANLRVILARGVLTENDVCKEEFKKLCDKLGISSDKDTIMKFIGAKNKKGLEQIATEGEINGQNLKKILSDQKIYKQMTPAEKMIYEITENRNLHIADEREAVARLYMMYCEKAQEHDMYSMEGNTCREIAKAFERYMLDKKEYFSEYLTFTKDAGVVNNRVTYANVKKVVGNKEPSKKTKLLLESTPKKIDRTLETLKGENSKISQKEFDDFFLYRSEDLAIAYENESKARREAKESQKDKFAKDNLSDMEKLKLYKAESVDDVSFAQIALFYTNKSYKVDPQDIKDKLFKYRNSKFYQTVLNENEEVDLDKLKEFAKTYSEEFNRGDLRKETVKYLLLTARTDAKMEDLDEVNKKNLQGILARGFLSEDKRNKRAFNRLCQNLGIGNDLKSILQITGCQDLEDLAEIRDDQELNSLNYMEKLSERKASKKMSLGEKRIFEITEELDLYIPENAEIIAIEFVKYSEKVAELPENSPEAKVYSQVADALKRLMKENNEKFSEYITTIRNGSTDIKNKVEYANVKKVLDAKNEKDKDSSKTHYIEDQIDSMIDSLRGEDGQISKDDYLKFFEEQNEQNAEEYKKEALKRRMDRNMANARLKPKQEKKQNPFVSWIKKTATNVKEKFKQMISRNKDKKLEAKGQKLLEEPKENEQLDRKQKDNNFVQVVNIDHEKAIEEMNNSRDTSRANDDQRNV